LQQLLNELFEEQELESSWAPLAQDVLSKLLIPCAVGPVSKVACFLLLTNIKWKINDFLG